MPEIFSDVVLLSRIQFALTIMFHYLYPPLSIGLGVLLVIFEGLYLKTKDPAWHSITKFFVTIFALVFGLGVASGIVMEFQFGTNWATYSRFVGDVFGSALAAEGIFAFFLESGFLAVLVFGWDKVSPKMHFFSTIMVALGSMFSAVWIVIANSWQQTPAGFHLVGYDKDGNQIPGIPEEGFLFADWLNNDIAVRAEITDFWELVFNPSSMVRLTHVLIGSFILASFFVMSVCGWYILKNKHVDIAQKAFKIALIFGAISSIAQLGAGHWSAHVVEKYQPAKLAAFEGVYETSSNAALTLFGWPNDAEQRVDYGMAIPGMLSWLIAFDTSYEVTGLDQFAPEDRPPVWLTFQMYHIMVALGMYFIGITWFALFLLWRGKLFTNRFLMWVFVFSVVLPYIANQTGWIAAEVGRQPWVVYELLRTSDGVSKAVAASNIVFSLVMFTLIYILLFAMFIYLLDRKIRKGPDDPFGPGKGETPAQDLLDVVTKRVPGRGKMADLGEPEEKEA